MMIDFRIVAVALSIASSLVTDKRLGPDFSLASRREDFKSFVFQFQDNYAYIDRSEKPWLTWSRRYSTAVDSAETPQAFAAVLESALDELHDFHAEVRSYNPHRFLPAPTFEDIYAEFRKGKARVVAVRPGGDAERAGVTVGDEVVQVQGELIERAVASRLGGAKDATSPNARQWALLSVLTGRSDESRRIVLRRKGRSELAVSLPVRREFKRKPGALECPLVSGDIGYIRFHNSLGDQATVAEFDHALAALQSTKGLILDLRDVPSGGNSSVALGIMGRFISTTASYQRHRIPHYGQPDVDRNWIEQVAPRGPFTYKAPLIVLVDHWTGSMGEGIAIGFDAMHRGQVLGTRMAGLAGAVSDFQLPKTGVQVAFATEQTFHVNGTPRQNWIPALIPEGSAESKGDPILIEALKRMKQIRR